MFLRELWTVEILSVIHDDSQEAPRKPLCKQAAAKTLALKGETELPPFF